MDYSSFTAEQKAIEYVKCKNNILYFIFNYVRIPEIGGSLAYTPEHLHPKLRRVVRSAIRFDKVMFMASRQLGKSTIAAVIIEYMMNFYPKNRAIIINMKKSAALENLNKIKFIHESLPDFLKPGADKKTLADRKTYLEYENGSRVDVFYPSTASGPDQIARSLTAPVLYIDEVAFINHIEAAYGAAQPVLSKARLQAKKHGYLTLLMMTSTPNGVEGTGKFFFDMWGNAVDSDEIFDEEEKLVTDPEQYINNPVKNGFVSVKFHWSEIYDNIWYQHQVRELNFNRRQINQELDLMFVAGSNCIFDDDFLSELTPAKPIDLIPLSHMCKLKIYKEFNPNDFYLIGVDTAKSLVGDLCAIQIFQYSNFEQVGEFISRIGSLTKYSEVVIDIIKYCISKVGKKIIVGIENNSIGTAVVEALENHNSMDLTQFLYQEDIKKPYGINTNVRTKDKMVSIFYDYVTSEKGLLHSGELITQLSIIEKKSNGSVSAQSGQHDDLFMAACFCALVKKDRMLDIEPLINVNMDTYSKKQESLINDIVNIDNKNLNRYENMDIGSYFPGAETTVFRWESEPKEEQEIDLSDIPLPEFF